MDVSGLGLGLELRKPVSNDSTKGVVTPRMGSPRASARSFCRTSWRTTFSALRAFALLIKYGALYLRALEGAVFPSKQVVLKVRSCEHDPSEKCRNESSLLKSVGCKTWKRRKVHYIELWYLRSIHQAFGADVMRFDIALKVRDALCYHLFLDLQTESIGV